jgi:hypothetical protein
MRNVRRLTAINGTLITSMLSPVAGVAHPARRCRRGTVASNDDGRSLDVGAFGVGAVRGERTAISESRAKTAGLDRPQPARTV